MIINECGSSYQHHTSVLLLCLCLKNMSQAGQADCSSPQQQHCLCGQISKAALQLLPVQKSLLFIMSK